MQNWTIQVKLKVADSWVADGFNASDKETIAAIEEKLAYLLPQSYGSEFIVEAKVIKAPKPEVVEQLQNGELEIKD